MASERRSIRIDPDDTATYERAVELPAQNGLSPRQRILESKRVDAAVLLPPSITSDILPHKCRFVQVQGENRLYVTEDAPSIKQVTWITEASSYNLMRVRLEANHGEVLYGESTTAFAQRLREQTSFRLAFPYLVWAHLFRAGKFVSSFIWYRRRPLTILRDGLMTPNLPNRYQHIGKLCLGKAFELKLDRSQPVSVQIAEVEADFWSSAWNHDLLEEFRAAALTHFEVASPWEWEANTQKDARFMLRVPFVGLEKTLGATLHSIITQESERSTASFQAFQDRIQKADHFDRFKPPVENLPVSPAESVVLRERMTLAVGDRVHFQGCQFSNVSKEVDYEIEWFGCANSNNDRYVKFKGVNEALLIIVANELVKGIRVVSGHQAIPVVVQGMTLESGSYCYVPSGGYQFYGYYQIVSSWRNAFGQIGVRLLGSDLDIVVGEGDTFYPGFRFLSAAEANAQPVEVTLADGSALKIGDQLFFRDRDYDQIRLVSVARFSAVRHATKGRSFRDHTNLE